ncbi:MAG: hypothetical protein IKX65_07265, partial [Prevotella sp.]|nr:hypothetical protein [Prevotella sp.]
QQTPSKLGSAFAPRSLVKTLSVPERRFVSIESARSQSDIVIIDGSYNPDAITKTNLETATASRTTSLSM